MNLKNTDDYGLDDKQRITRALEHAAHLLPDQAPLHAFVHHNTLHAFEHLHFKEALRQASEFYGAATLMAESKFHQALKSGRIKGIDIESVIQEEVDGVSNVLFAHGPTRQQLLYWRLTHPLVLPPDVMVDWWLHDRGYLAKPHPASGTAVHFIDSPLIEKNTRHLSSKIYEELWQRLYHFAPPKVESVKFQRPRDFFLETHDIDTDEWLFPYVIRLAGAFLDQGVANIAMPHKEKGFLSAFQHYALTSGVLVEPWLASLKNIIRSDQQKHLDAYAIVGERLHGLGVAPCQWHNFISALLCALPGWAGMFSKLERSPEAASVSAPNVTLLDYLAVVLTMEFCALRTACQRVKVPFDSLMQAVESNGLKRAAQRDEKISAACVYEAFVAAQAFDLSQRLINDADARLAFVTEIFAFDSFERRYLLQLAYERRHRQLTLDAVFHHAKFASGGPAKPRMQAIFCMDEREESVRRHLEESAPAVETFGCAGFFGVAMHYKGFHDVTSRPLCPVTRKPTHLIEELAVDEGKADAYRMALRKRGLWLSRTADIGQQSSIFGAAWALLVGLGQAVFLVGHSVAPLHTNHAHHHVLVGGLNAPKTRLRLFRENEEKNSAGLYLGFSVDEAAEIVSNQLKFIGLSDRFAPVIVIVGHGSSSLNNPHEAAHDCGATGGGRGGPNARAFAQMANDARVRRALVDKGIIMDDNTWFVGAYHNTCDDSIEYYDLEMAPKHLVGPIDAVREKLALACLLDAQERCRRFEDAQADISKEQALDTVRKHALDLAQPRPEYGHATNAICYIGRRNETRGLYLDRRAFLISYDPFMDEDDSMLAAILESAGPVGAGINLEYYFSYVDPTVFGCGTKLPHNITGLIGVMDGHASDLRTGLPWQMVEIHEPVRLLTIVEATPESLFKIAQQKPVVQRLVVNEWIQLVSKHPQTGELKVLKKGAFVSHKVEVSSFPVHGDSHSVYAGVREHLGFAHIINARPMSSSACSQVGEQANV